MIPRVSLEAPADLANAISYQDGAIVSQALMKAKGGTVTLFAFDGGEGLSEHTAPYDALVLAVDGSATVAVGGKSHQISLGQIVLFPAGVPHSIQADDRFKMLLIMMRSADA